MSNILRYSSRSEHLGDAFLKIKLKNAKSYRRIAGYFRSSIFELIGEEIGHLTEVKILCNSELDLRDFNVAKQAQAAALKGLWGESSPERESLLYRDRYRQLFELLRRGNLQIRVVAKSQLFLHGKAGIIEGNDGSKIGFLGSANETKSAFDQNYEIIWEDGSTEGVHWIETEFDQLWRLGCDLPEAVIEEIGRISQRIEVQREELIDDELPSALLAEAPIYRAGDQLQLWQRQFVAEFFWHRKTFGQARLLLADEVGLGKTLSMATCALLAALLDEGPILILCPSTLTLQWQIELKDRLGIPSAVWRSQQKSWLDHSGHEILTRGAEDIVRCPCQIGIVSTGLVTRGSSEINYLKKLRYNMVIADEAHRARYGKTKFKTGSPNNLLKFLMEIGPSTKHLLLGTATPIQTEVRELWDLLAALSSGAKFVLGSGIWNDSTGVPHILRGVRTPKDGREAWEWLRNPLPPYGNHRLSDLIRSVMGIDDKDYMSAIPYSQLEVNVQQSLELMLNEHFFKLHNPIVRHVVMRRREQLERENYLPKIGVNLHPQMTESFQNYPVQFNELSLITNHNFELAYQEFSKYTKLRSCQAAKRGGGFLQSLLLQRLCSSFASAKATAKRLLEKNQIADEETEGDEEVFNTAEISSPDQVTCLMRIIDELSRPEARDPKLKAVHAFLTQHTIEGKTWLEHGCIVFSQFYDTAEWIARSLSQSLPSEILAIYAGSDKSRLYRDGISANIKREEIKEAVRKREIRLVIATDAASEGLNLQTLGCLINIDLPWNPARLEQRLGRIKRLGQTRYNVDMLNLVYADTMDEKIWNVISRRMRDRYNIFGNLPDTINDDWIEQIAEFEKMTDKYVHLREQAKSNFSLSNRQYREIDDQSWEKASKVMARKDIMEKMSKRW